mmetsp:Transcript_21341/g.50522  ORF Transcript_21341/g.50522 Transcript_21341/m.50522 type:complete len:150 (+) Transcript_21341:486-935(+)
MSTNNDRWHSRDGRKRRIDAGLPSRIPKKNRSRSESNGSSDGQREEEGAVIEKEEEELDPVAAARKALEMFQEVSGESVAIHNTSSDIRTGDNDETSDSRTQSDAERAEERRKLEERKEKERKRIAAGEAKRREFRPRIAGLQESNCLL